MKAFNFAQKIISTLSLDPLLPGYAAISFALSDKTRGLLGGFVDTSGNLNVGGIVGNTTLCAGSANVDFSAFAGVLKAPKNGLGYFAGAGGTVTQATSKSTGVTLNKASGQVTLNNAALAAGTIVSFALTNSLIGANDTLVLNHVSGGTVGSYTLNAQPASGSATINVRNNTAGSLSDAIVIGFNVIKGSGN